MDDNLDKAKKDILNEADGLLKRGKSMNDNHVDLFTGDLPDDSGVYIYMNNPTKDGMPFVTICIGMFSFGIPLFAFTELARALNIADGKIAQFYKDNAGNIKEHECDHDHSEDEEEDQE